MKTVIQKLFSMLTKRERRQIYWLIPLLIFQAVISMLGVASVMPFLAVVSNTAPKGMHRP